MPALIAIALGLVLGVLAGGSVRRVGAMKLPGELLILGLFVVQGVARGRLPGMQPTGAGIQLWVVSSVALTVLLARVVSRHGFYVICMGLGLNLLVVIANSGMPVLLPSWQGLQQSEALTGQTQGFYQIVDGSTLLAGLGDVLPLALGGTQLLLSVGDVLMAVGVSVVVVHGCLLDAGEAAPATGAGHSAA